MEGNSFREAATREALVRLLVFILSSLLFPLPRRPKAGRGPRKFPHPPVPQCRLQRVTQNQQDVNYSAQRLCIVSAFHPGTVRCDVPEERTRSRGSAAENQSLSAAPKVSGPCSLPVPQSLSLAHQRSPSAMLPVLDAGKFPGPLPQLPGPSQREPSLANLCLDPDT